MTLPSLVWGAPQWLRPPRHLAGRRRAALCSGATAEPGPGRRVRVACATLEGRRLRGADAHAWSNRC